jgi:hypothetical protein
MKTTLAKLYEDTLAPPPFTIAVDNVRIGSHIQDRQASFFRAKLNAITEGPLSLMNQAAVEYALALGRCTLQAWIHAVISHIYSQVQCSARS